MIITYDIVAYVFYALYIGGEDYTIQNKEPIIIYPEDKQKRAIFIDTVDDDVVETLIEEFYIDISYVANENGGVNDYLKIGKDNRTTLQIKDDDGKNSVCLISY